MNPMAALRKLFTTSPVVAATAYAGLVLVLLILIVSSLLDLLGQRAAVDASAAMLEQLDGRSKTPAPGARPSDAVTPAGSAFLEGATVTVAGAALLQRVAGAVTKFGGNVLSTQVELKGTQSKAGFISLLASCEIEQVGLQQLLYDLEAGMPFLFIDQLVVQAASTQSSSGGGKLRILLSVSGQWQSAK
jgi:general secretion pathway protein M